MDDNPNEAAPPHAPDKESDLATFVERLVIEQSLPADPSRYR